MWGGSIISFVHRLILNWNGKSFFAITNVHFFQHIIHKVFLELFYLEFPLEMEAGEDGSSDAITTKKKCSSLCYRICMQKSKG